MKKSDNFGKFSDKKFRIGILLVCLSYLKEGLPGYTTWQFESLRTYARSSICRLKVGPSGPKIFEWSGKMGRRGPPGGDYIRWVQESSR